MATIETTTNSTPFQYPGNRYVALANGHGELRTLVKTSTADTYKLRGSTDGGTTWNDITGSTIVRANIADAGEIYIDNFDWVYWVYRLNLTSQDIILYRRFGNGGWTNEQEVGRVGNGGVAGTIYSGMSIVTHLHSTGWTHVAIAVGTNVGGNQGVTLLGGTIDNVGNLMDGNYRFSGTKQWLYPGTAGRVGPSIDIEHGGDGYDTSFSTPNLWCTFGRTELRMVKVAWSGDGWTGSPGATKLVAGTITAVDTTPAKWDGSRFISVIRDPVSTSKVLILERNRANSTTQTRQSATAHPQGVIRQATMSYGVFSGNVRIYAVGTSTAVVYYIDYVRATNSWTAWTSTGLAAVLGANVDNYGARISDYGYSAYGLYTAASGAPNTLTYTAQATNQAPTAPTWVTPTSGAAQDVAVSLPLDWQHNDPDPGDAQLAYALSRQVGAAALEYWRASDSTWQVAEVKNTSGTTALTLTATQWSIDGTANGATDPNHSYKVKTWDLTDVASVYSAALIVVPSAKVNPAITAPTAASTLTGTTVTVTWTATEQTQYRMQMNITSGIQVYDSGWVTDAAARSLAIPYILADNGNYTVTLTTKNLEGLASTVQTRQFLVDYVPPMSPTIVASPMPLAGIMRVTITNPTPAGGAPAVASQELWRRVVGDTSAGVRIGANLANAAVVDDWQAIGGVAYEYRSIVTGTNGTSTTGAWFT